MEYINKYAILVGASNCQDKIKQLPYVHNDVYRMAVSLKNGGFPTNKITILADQGRSSAFERTLPTCDNIISNVEQVAFNARHDDLIFFYIAGHFVDIFSRPYLIASDSKLDFLLTTTVNLADLLSILEQSRCKNIIKCFDIGRTNICTERKLVSNMTSSALRVLTKPTAGHATLVSCSAGQMALESPDLKQGVCSYFISNALCGVDSKEKSVTWEYLSEYVQNQMHEWCKLNNAVQNPVIESDYFGPTITEIISIQSEQQETIHETITQDTDEQTIPKEIAPLNNLNIQTFYHKEHIKPVKKSPVIPKGKTFTNALDQLLSVLDAFIKDFSHPSITVYRTEPVKLSILSYFVNQEFEKYLYEKNNDQVVQSMAVQIFFRNNMNYAPNTSLYINLLKFTDYYWIWYCLPFETLRSEGSFVPADPIKTDIIALREPQLFDHEKMDKYISNIFLDCTETIIEWAKELHLRNSKG